MEPGKLYTFVHNATSGHFTPMKFVNNREKITKIVCSNNVDSVYVPDGEICIYLCSAVYNGKNICEVFLYDKYFIAVCKEYCDASFKQFDNVEISNGY